MCSNINHISNRQHKNKTTSFVCLFSRINLFSRAKAEKHHLEELELTGKDQQEIEKVKRRKGIRAILKQILEEEGPTGIFTI